MQELTEREQKLISIIKTLINVITIWGIYENKSKELRTWTYGAMGQAGLNNEFQDETLHTLESEFGLKYKKLNPETYEEIEEDGSKS